MSIFAMRVERRRDFMCLASNSGSLACSQQSAFFASGRPNDNQEGKGKLLESSLPGCPKATTVALKQENVSARQTAATIARTDERSGQNLALAGKDPRDRRERYRSKWAGINTFRGLTAPPRSDCAKAPAAWRYSPQSFAPHLCCWLSRMRGAGDNLCPASYFQLSDGPKSRSSFCRVSRSDSQYRTNKSGPATRKSCSTARRQKGLRPLSQACPSGGNRGKIDSSKMEFGVSVVFLRAAPFCGSVGLNSSATRLVRSSIGVTLFSQCTVTALSVRA